MCSFGLEAFLGSNGKSVLVSRKAIMWKIILFDTVCKHQENRTMFAAEIYTFPISNLPFCPCQLLAMSERLRPVGSPPGGRKKEVPARYQWLYERKATGSLGSWAVRSQGSLASPRSPTEKMHFPPEPRRMERSDSGVLSLGHSSPSGVGFETQILQMLVS